MLLGPQLSQLQSLSRAFDALEVLVFCFFDELKVLAYLGIAELSVKGIHILRGEIQVDGLLHVFYDGSDLHLALLDLRGELLYNSV